MDILLIGGTGQVGTELRSLPCPPGVRVFAPGRDQLDLTRRSQVVSCISSQNWAVVINAAAYTQVDRAESEKDLAFEINAAVPGLLAEETNRRGIPLVHISTDYVFDGLKGEPYVETDPVAPVNVYGASKEAGERAVRSCNRRHLIIRTSWLYSPFGTNFVRTMLRLAKDRDRLSIVNDQRGSPTAARDLAEACLSLAIRMACEPTDCGQGTYHLSGTGDTTWCEFARAIFELARRSGIKTPEVIAITTAEYTTPARRPLDTRLNCDAITRDWGVRAQPWQIALEQTLARFLHEKELG